MRTEVLRGRVFHALRHSDSDHFPAGSHGTLSRHGYRDYGFLFTAFGDVAADFQFNAEWCGFEIFDFQGRRDVAWRRPIANLAACRLLGRGSRRRHGVTIYK